MQVLALLLTQTMCEVGAGKSAHFTSRPEFQQFERMDRDHLHTPPSPGLDPPPAVHFTLAKCGFQVEPMRWRHASVIRVHKYSVYLH